MVTRKYTLPSGKKIKLGEIKVEAYLRLAEAHSSNLSRLSDELVKATVLEFDGQKVDASSIHKVWADLSNKERELVRRAYSSINHTSEEEEKSFFDTEEVEIVA
jgi:23S rRNA maturation mini-RNase III